MAGSGGLCIVDGLPKAAPLGARLDFYPPGTAVEDAAIRPTARGGIILRRDDDAAVCLVVEGTVSEGDAAGLERRNHADVDAPFGLLCVRAPRGRAAGGRELRPWRGPVDWRGRRVGSDGVPMPADASSSEPDPAEADLVDAPLFPEHPPMSARQSIDSGLTTGVRGIDVLSPLGRGQSLVLAGPDGVGKTTLALDALAGSSDDLHLVYCSVGQPPQAVDAAVARLSSVLPRLDLVAAGPEAGPADRYATLCAALATAEQTRDAGGQALVVLDDAGAATDLWVAAQAAAEGRDRALYLADGVEGDALVDYEGTLVSAASAQRRRLLSSLLQRSARLLDASGGGTLTLLAVLPGEPATGRPRGSAARARVLSLAGVTEDQRARMLAALDKQEAAAGGMPTTLERARSEVLEEFMSICDGQAVLRRADGPAGLVQVDPRKSLSRIGVRAYWAQGLAERAPALRFQLAQAEDEAEWAGARDGSAVAMAAFRAASAAAAPGMAACRALLLHAPGQSSTAGEEICLLACAREGLLGAPASTDEVSACRDAWAAAWQDAKRALPEDVALLEDTGVEGADEVIEWLRGRLSSAA